LEEIFGENQGLPVGHWFKGVDPVFEETT
jgi:hypothetical protein